MADGRMRSDRRSHFRRKNIQGRGSDQHRDRVEIANTKNVPAQMYLNFGACCCIGRPPCAAPAPPYPFPPYVCPGCDIVFVESVLSGLIARRCKRLWGGAQRRRRWVAADILKV
jgi:hypothetical protein